MKNLVMTVNFGNTPSWAIAAKAKQLNDWLCKNKANLPFENIILMPDSTGDTRLYWLEGEDIPKDRIQLEAIRDKIKPILNVVIQTNMSKEDINFQSAMEELKTLRAERSKKLNK